MVSFHCHVSDIKMFTVHATHSTHYDEGTRCLMHAERVLHIAMCDVQSPKKVFVHGWVNAPVKLMQKR